MPNSSSDAPAALCAVTWGVCPDHGATLVHGGGRTECRRPDCTRSWDGDRFGGPCTEPASHQVRDIAGGTLDICAGHAKAIDGQLEGAVISRLDTVGDAG